MNFSFLSMFSTICATYIFLLGPAASADSTESVAENRQFEQEVQDHFSHPTQRGLLQVLIYVQHGNEGSNLDDVERYVYYKLNKLKFKPGEMSQRYASEIEGFVYAYTLAAEQIEKMRDAYNQTGKTQSHLLHFHLMESKGKRAKRIAYQLAKHNLLDGVVRFNTAQTRTTTAEYSAYLSINQGPQMTKEEFARMLIDNASKLDQNFFSVSRLHALSVVDLNSCQGHLF